MSKAEEADVPAMGVAQRAAFKEFAELWKNPNCYPFIQPDEEILEELRKYACLKAVDTQTGKLIGSIRADVKSDTEIEIEWLSVHPDYQGRGIGGLLLRALEGAYPGYLFKLFTNNLQPKNVTFYVKQGYTITGEGIYPADGCPVTYLEKQLPKPAAPKPAGKPAAKPASRVVAKRRPSPKARPAAKGTK